MASIISQRILTILCDHQGSLDFKDLEGKIAQDFTVEESILRSILFDDDRIVMQEGSPSLPGGPISPDTLFVAKTSLRLCQRKHGECHGCARLHLCRYWVSGNCMYRQNCKNPHSLVLPHNADILRNCGLQDLTEKQLFQLLLQNDPFLLPEICPHYNRGSTVHGSCRFATACTKLHVCQHHFQGDCKFGASCKRVHHVNGHQVKIFAGFSLENKRNLLQIYRNGFIIRGQQERNAAATVLPEASDSSPQTSADATEALSEAEGKEICLFFIRRSCSFKERCHRVHWFLPYRWQVLDSDGNTWKDLPNMEGIEKAYCDPGQDTSCMAPPSWPSGSSSCPSSPAEQSVDFTTMTYGGSQVRRLSTTSSVLKPPHFILTTQWMWYWKDDGGKWMEFGQSETGTPVSISTQTLENVYSAGIDREIVFGAGEQQHSLSFTCAPGTQQMYQQNLEDKSKQEVRRRPRFVSTQDVEVQLKSEASRSSSSSRAENVPSHWDKNCLPEAGYKLVPLSTSPDDEMIKILFRQTMPNSHINSIQRIQNPSLWEAFKWKREQMKTRNGGKPVNEQYLFHWVDESLFTAVCEQNFDWRVSLSRDTKYGKGSSFAKYACDVDNSNRAPTRSKRMFVALVLVGEYTRGRPGCLPPPRKGTSRNIDSCVDDERNPRFFVIADKHQIYPEYVIDYS
ncbi:protein mono-ADP-ribosyltransferase PARP12 [Aulostomus maculatus]